MGWYKKEAAPLPRATGYPDEYGRNYRGGYDKIDEALPEEITDPLGELDYVAEGHLGGIALEPKITDLETKKNNLMVKYTVDATEFQAAERIMQIQKETGQPLPYAVEVFEANPVEGSKGAYRLLLEKVTPLEGTAYGQYMQYMTMGTGGRNLQRLNKGLPLYFVEGQYGDGDRQKREFEEYEGHDTFDIEMHNKTKEMLQNFINAMEADGVSSTDAHIGNLGIRQDGSIVLLDLGYTRF